MPCSVNRYLNSTAPVLGSGAANVYKNVRPFTFRYFVFSSNFCFAFFHCHCLILFLVHCFLLNFHRMANLLVELSPFYSSRENFSSQYTKIRDSASAADYSSLFFQDAFHSAQTAEGGACGGSRKRRRLPDELSVGNAQNAAVSDKPLPEREALSIDKKAAQKLRNRLSAQHHRERQKKFLTDIRAELELSFCIRRELEWYA